jgi:hypothetical protein
MSRRKNVEWILPEPGTGNVTYDVAKLAVLMDIRDELQRLNAIFHCGNFLSIPLKIERIARSTAKPRTKKAAR